MDTDWMDDNYWQDKKNGKNIADLAWFLATGSTSGPPQLSSSLELLQYHRKAFKTILDKLILATMPRRSSTVCLTKFTKAEIVAALGREVTERGSSPLSLVHPVAQEWLGWRDSDNNSKGVTCISDSQRTIIAISRDYNESKRRLLEMVKCVEEIRDNDKRIPIGLDNVREKAYYLEKQESLQPELKKVGREVMQEAIKSIKEKVNDSPEVIEMKLRGPKDPDEDEKPLYIQQQDVVCAKMNEVFIREAVAIQEQIQLHSYAEGKPKTYHFLMVNGEIPTIEHIAERLQHIKQELLGFS